MLSDEAGPTLEALSLDCRRLAEALAGLAESERLRRIAGGDGRAALTAPLVRSLNAARRLRRERLGPLFAPEPGWSVMLALYAARLEGRTPTLAALTRSADAPVATVYGRLLALEAEGLLERRPDPERRRGTLVALTDEAAARMEAYLREAREI
ncbi:MAG TPA: hypothetical protein VEW26_13795 [Allosphingosinicella sp.]|nr:hypothetical protein [Allosphingosinicella sp.]